MKISCYNKGTKEKESNKKCLKFSKSTWRRKDQCTKKEVNKG